MWCHSLRNLTLDTKISLSNKNSLGRLIGRLQIHKYAAAHGQQLLITSPEVAFHVKNTEHRSGEGDMWVFYWNIKKAKSYRSFIWVHWMLRFLLPELSIFISHPGQVIFTIRHYWCRSNTAQWWFIIFSSFDKKSWIEVQASISNCFRVSGGVLWVCQVVAVENIRIGTFETSSLWFQHNLPFKMMSSQNINFRQTIQ